MLVFNQNFIRAIGAASFKRSFSFLALLFLLLPGYGYTQALIEEITVSVPSYQDVNSDDMLKVYQRALTYDAEYQRALFEYEASKEGIKQAKSRLLPSVAAYTERSEFDQDIKASDIDIIGRGQSDYGRTTYGISITQSVFDWERITGFNQAKREDVLADMQLLEAQQNLIIKVAERYINVLAAKDNLSFLEKEEAAVREQENAAAARWQAKLGREADYLEAKARATSVYAEKLAAQNALEDAIEALRELSGYGADEYKALNEEIELITVTPNSVDDWTEKAVAENVSILQQRYATSIARMEIKRKKSGHYPTLDLYGRFNNQEEDGSLFGGSSEVETFEYGLRLEIPLYSGGGTSSEVREAASTYHVELQRLQDQVRQITRETKAAFNDLSTSISKIDSFLVATEAQLAVVETKRRGYPRLYTSREVLDSERDYYSARRDLAKARYEYLLASLRLKSAAGFLNEADIQEMNTLFQ